MDQAYTAVYELKMIKISIPFDRAFNECIQINTFAVIIEKPTFGDHIQ